MYETNQIVNEYGLEICKRCSDFCFVYYGAMTKNGKFRVSIPNSFFPQISHKTSLPKTPCSERKQLCRLRPSFSHFFYSRFRSKKQESDADKEVGFVRENVFFCFIFFASYSAAALVAACCICVVWYLGPINPS